MTVARFENFDITIRNLADHGDEPPYSVTARYRDHTADGLFEQTSSSPDWQQTLALLRNPAHDAGRATIMDAGSQLFQGLMQQDVRDLWLRARADLESQNRAVRGIRLRLALHPPAVASLPWESLFDPDRNEAFAANSRVLLTRVETLYRYVGDARALRTALPIKILIAAPDDPHGLLQSETEVARIEEALVALGENFAQSATLRGHFDVVTLRKTIAQEQPDVLHVIGHGEPNGIWLWQKEEPTLAPASSLRTILADAASVKLVFLNTCLAGASDEQQPFATVAPQLLQAQIPAVIAMQMEIEDEVATDFALHVYASLTGGTYAGAIDSAVAYARSNLYALNPDSFAYCTPVLWLNQQDGIVFEMSEAEADALESGSSNADAAKTGNATSNTAEESAGGGASPRPGSALDDLDFTAAEEITLLGIQAGEIETWLETLPSATADVAPAQMRMILTVWEQGVTNLRGLFYQLHHIEQAPEAERSPALILPRYRAKIAQIRQQRSELANLEEIVRQYAGGGGG